MTHGVVAAQHADMLLCTVDACEMVVLFVGERCCHRTAVSLVRVQCAAVSRHHECMLFRFQVAAALLT